MLLTSEHQQYTNDCQEVISCKVVLPLFIVFVIQERSEELNELDGPAENIFNDFRSRR